MNEHGEGEEPSILGGRFYFTVDEGFQVVFRSARGRLVRNAFVLLAMAVIIATALLVTREGGKGPLVWLVASLFALAAIIVLFLIRNALDPGPIVVDGSLRLVHLPKGAEISFERIRSVRCEKEGSRPMVRLRLDDGELRLLQRESSQAEAAAAAVARILESK